jgi:hypothetical protein
MAQPTKTSRGRSAGVADATINRVGCSHADVPSGNGIHTAEVQFVPYLPVLKKKSVRSCAGRGS